MCVKIVSESCSVVSHSLRPHGIVYVLHARILEWVAFPSPRDLPNPGIKPRSAALQVDSLPAEPAGKPLTEKCSDLGIPIVITVEFSLFLLLISETDTADL